MRDFDPKYPEGIDAEFNEWEREREEGRETIRQWKEGLAMVRDDMAYEAQEQAAVDAEYDPNADAFDHEMESRIERERELRYAQGYDTASDTTYHAGHTDTPRCPVCVPPVPWVILRETVDVDAMVAAIDKLEASVARLKRFLMVEP